MHRKPASVMMSSDIHGAQDSHERNAVVSQGQKGVGCVTGWKRGGQWVHLVELAVLRVKCLCLREDDAM
jgi:hypothetical protein